MELEPTRAPLSDESVSKLVHVQSFHFVSHTAAASGVAVSTSSGKSRVELELGSSGLTLRSSLRAVTRALAADRARGASCLALHGAGIVSQVHVVEAVEKSLVILRTGSTTAAVTGR